MLVQYDILSLHGQVPFLFGPRKFLSSAYAYSFTDVQVVECSVDSCCVYQLAPEAPPDANPPKPTPLAAEPCRYYAAIEAALPVAWFPKLDAAAEPRPKDELALVAGAPPKLGPDPPNAAAAPVAGPPKEGLDLTGDALVAPTPPKPTEPPPKPYGAR